MARIRPYSPQLASTEVFVPTLRPLGTTELSIGLATSLERGPDTPAGPTATLATTFWWSIALTAPPVAAALLLPGGLRPDSTITPHGEQAQSPKASDPSLHLDSPFPSRLSGSLTARTEISGDHIESLEDLACSVRLLAGDRCLHNMIDRRSPDALDSAGGPVGNADDGATAVLRIGLESDGAGLSKPGHRSRYCTLWQACTPCDPTDGALRVIDDLVDHDQNGPLGPSAVSRKSRFANLHQGPTQQKELDSVHTTSVLQTRCITIDASVLME